MSSANNMDYESHLIFVSSSMIKAKRYGLNLDASLAVIENSLLLLPLQIKLMTALSELILILLVYIREIPFSLALTVALLLKP